MTMDRDLNGARGIFLRALVDRPWLLTISNLQTIQEKQSPTLFGNV
jgi:hypothetical protein